MNLFVIGWITVFVAAIIFIISCFLSLTFALVGIISSVLILLTGIYCIITYWPITTPTSVIAQAGNTIAYVSFSDIADANSYTVTSSPGNRTATGERSPIMVRGLINDIPYTFTVVANTNHGTSPLSEHSNVVIPRDLPTAPINIVATPSDASATITFTTTDIGKASYYTVLSTPGNFTQTGTSSPIVVTGLTNGIGYEFTIRSYDEIGQFTVSLPSNYVVPSAALNDLYKPMNINSIPMHKSASVSFTPSNVKGLLYRVTSTPGNIQATGTSSPIIVNGLENGVSYTFTITSESKDGVSLPTTSNEIKPLTVPLTPTDAHVITYGDNEAYIGFETRYPYGDIIYTATSIPDGKTGSSYITPILVEGLEKGKGYIFTVTASNTAGPSAPSKPTSEILMN